MSSGFCRVEPRTSLVINRSFRFGQWRESWYTLIGRESFAEDNEEPNDGGMISVFGEKPISVSESE